jgi:Family of unknown function (DUF6228)
MAQGNQLLAVRSTNSNRALHIGGAIGSSIPVKLTGFPVTADTEVWFETGDVDALADFFAELGQMESPWQGARAWESLEGDFRLSVTCSSLGAVLLRVELRGLQGAPEEWHVEVGIETEFGQLEHMAKEAEGLRNA